MGFPPPDISMPDTQPTSLRISGRGIAYLCSRYFSRNALLLFLQVCSCFLYNIYGYMQDFHLNPYIYIKLQTISYFISSANFFIASKSLSFITDLIVTTVSAIVTSFIVSKIPFIVRAAHGAQEPFSKIPTLRFWYAFI